VVPTNGRSMIMVVAVVVVDENFCDCAVAISHFVSVPRDVEIVPRESSVLYSLFYWLAQPV
jgi:hypothetical protein